MKWLPEAAEVLGFLAILLGISLLSPIAGLVLGGLLCVGAGVALQLIREAK